MNDTVTLASDLPIEVARQIGAAPQIAASDEELPEAKIDWALRWAEAGLHVFPCKSFLGLPLVSKWYREATTSAEKIIGWWNEWPDADIGVVPHSSGHFVISVVGGEGRTSLDGLEENHGELEPDFVTETRWGTTHLWFKGRAFSSHHRLGKGLHTTGRGGFLYLPPSLAFLAIE